MTKAALAILALLLSAPDPLRDAEAAFAAGDYANAEALALSAPPSGASLYLAGLARFRSGRPAEALEALDAAGKREDAPPRAAWQFNRAACLYQLGRNAEAEAAFVEAAGLDTSLARVALVNAGFAALDGGARDRAKALLARAEAGASESELALAADLEAALAEAEPAEAEESEYAAGLSAFDRAEYAEARRHFVRAAELDPTSGRSRLMAGAAAARLGARAEAREDLQKSIALQLEPGEADVARDYLDSMSPGLRSLGRGLSLEASALSGYDSNPFQVGAARPEIFQSPSEISSGSPLGSATLRISDRFRPREGWFAELSYRLDQLAYLAPAAADSSLQQHLLAGAIEWNLPAHLRVGASLGADAVFLGLSRFRPLEAGAIAGGWLALDEADSTSTRLDVSWTGNRALPPPFAPRWPFAYLSGRRIDAVLSQELRLSSVAATAYLRYRSDGLGTAIEDVSAPPPPVLCPSGCVQQQVVPLGYQSLAGGLSARWAPWAKLYLGIDAGLEGRGYDRPSFLRLLYLDGSIREVDHRLRQDLRFDGALLAGYQLTPKLAIDLRYDLALNTSNVDTRIPDPVPGMMGEGCNTGDFTCHRFDYGNLNFDKHQVQLGVRASW